MSHHNRSSPRRWTPQEDRLLSSQVDLFSRRKLPVDWSAVSSAFVSRSNKDCRKRWQKIDTRWNSGAWTESEDEKLRSGVVSHGMCWAAISALIETRSPDQSAKRWRNVLDPSLDHGEWTPHDESRLYELVQMHGRDWKLIAETAFPNRSRQDLSNRYALLLRKENNRGSHSENTLYRPGLHSPNMEYQTSSDVSPEAQYRCSMDELSDRSSIPAASQELASCFDLFDGAYDDVRWLPSTNANSGNTWNTDMFGNSGDNFRLDCQPIRSSTNSDTGPFSLPPLMLRGEKAPAAASTSCAPAAGSACRAPANAPAVSKDMPIVSTSEVRSTGTETPLQQPTDERRPAKTVITISNLSANMRTAIVDMVLQEGGCLSIATE